MTKQLDFAAVEADYRLCWEYIPSGETGVIGSMPLEVALEIRNRLNRAQEPPLTVYHWVAQCQSTSHQPTACYGTLWECNGCKKMVCCADGTDSGDKAQDGLCDACWHERYGVAP